MNLSELQALLDADVGMTLGDLAAAQASATGPEAAA